MRVSMAEFRKIFTNSSILLTILCVFLLNGIVSFYGMKEETGRQIYSSKQYKEVQNEIQAMDDKEAASYLENRINESVSSMEDFFSTDTLVFRDIEEEINNCITYEHDLDEKNQRIWAFLSSPLARSTIDYAKRSNLKAYKDYSYLARVSDEGERYSVAHSNYKGIEKAILNVTTDFMILFLILLLVVQLVTKERDRGELQFYKTTYHGKKRLWYAKLLVIIATTIFITLLFWITNFLIGVATYGGSGFENAIQAIPMFRDSIETVSINYFIKMFLFEKTLVMLVMALLFYMIAVISKKSVWVYVMVIILFAVGVVLYFGISDNSSLMALKYLNLYAVTRVELLFTYLHLDIFEIPFYYVRAWALSLAYFGAMFLVAGKEVFEGQQETEKRIELAPSLFHHLRTRQSIVVQELYKFWVDGKAFVLLAIYIVFSFISFKPAIEEFFVMDDIQYYSYVDQLAGPVTDEKLSFIKDERAYFDDIEQRYQKGEIEDASYSLIKEKMDAFTKVEMELTPFLQEYGGSYVYDTPFNILTGKNYFGVKDVKLAFLVVIVLVFPLAYCYGMEYQSGTIVLLNSYVKGGKPTRRTKLAIGTGLVLITYLITYLPFYISVFHYFGKKGILEPITSLEHLCHMPEWMTILGYLIMVAVMRFIGLLLVMLLLYGVSKKTRSVITNCIVGIAVVLLPLVFAFLEVPGTKYILLNPLLIGNVF